MPPGWAGFVIGGDALLFSEMTIDLRSGTHQDLVLGLLEVRISTMFLSRRAASRAASLTSDSRSAPEKPGCRAIPRPGRHRDRSVLGERVRAGCPRALDVGTRHDDAAVEAAGTQQRRIEHVRAVGGGDHDDAVVRLKSVHLDEELVQRLLALIMAATKSGATVTTTASISSIKMMHGA